MAINFDKSSLAQSLSLAFLVFCFSLSNTSVASKGVKSNWDAYIDSFRSDHNLSYILGRSQGSWQVDHFAGLSNKSYFSQGYLLKFNYSFHIPFKRTLGYFLGSSAGFQIEAGDQEEFKIPVTLQLPGFLVGVVWDASAYFRVLLRLESYLERLDGITNQRNQKSLNANMLVWTDISVIFDFFFNIDLGVRLEAHQRLSVYSPMKNSGPNHVEYATFVRDDQWVGVGLVHHFL